MIEPHQFLIDGQSGAPPGAGDTRLEAGQPLYFPRLKLRETARVCCLAARAGERNFGLGPRLNFTGPKSYRRPDKLFRRWEDCFKAVPQVLLLASELKQRVVGKRHSKSSS